MCAQNSLWVKIRYHVDLCVNEQPQQYCYENKLFLNDDHDEVRFVLDQHTLLDFYGATSLK